MVPGTERVRTFFRKSIRIGNRIFSLGLLKADLAALQVRWSLVFQHTKITHTTTGAEHRNVTTRNLFLLKQHNRYRLGMFSRRQLLESNTEL